MQPARDPILTRSRAATARSGDGSGFQPAAVKEEAVELPTPADNGEGGSSEPFSAEGQGVSWSLGAPFARWFASEEEDEDDMEGALMGGGPSKVVKFTGSNRVMRLSELKNMVYQKTLAGGSKRPQSAHTMTQVEKFGILRECCDGEVSGRHTSLLYKVGIHSEFINHERENENTMLSRMSPCHTHHP
jgi:hypothetical protein